VHSLLFFQIFYAMGIQWGWFLAGVGFAVVLSG
jgi:hypothetical protein